MKHTRYIHVGILLLTVVLAVACNSYKKKAQETPQTTEETVSAVPSSRLLTDSLLPQSVDLNQDISCAATLTPCTAIGSSKAT